LRRARPLLGTLVEITVSGPGPAGDLAAALDDAFRAIEQIQRLMSFHDEHSDVSRINRAGARCAVSIDPLTHAVLARAIRLGQLSEGLFDVTTADVLVKRGFLPPVAGAEAPPEPTVTYRDIELLDDARMQWRCKGYLDLGGIAKGFAVDHATATLQTHEVAAAVVNAGGDLRSWGPQPQPIHVRRPDAPTQYIRLGRLSSAALATSAGYFSDRTLDPLVDPRQAECVTWGGSITVVADDCITADALTKVVRLAPSRAPTLLEQLGAQAFVISEQGMSVCGATRLVA
jgi:thiamine biosynthesis lipoprotein